MHRISLINMKGGCGKTTVATSLAAYYASSGIKTCLTDYDPQGSSIGWLKRRSIDRPIIYGIDTHNRNKSTTLSWQLQPPADTEISIIDTPAGIDINSLRRIIERSDTLLIPVMPSQIDIQAAAHFIETLLIRGKVREKGINLGIIANRIHAKTISYKSLERFLSRLDIPLVAKFRSIQAYVQTNDKGLGILESLNKQTLKEQEQWNNLAQWLDNVSDESLNKVP